MVSNTRLINLVNDITNNRKYLTKQQSNLPAKLLALTNNNTHDDNILPTQILPPAKKNKHLQTKKHTKTNNVVAKTVSSIYSSVMHNGHTHSQGKKVINDSNKPYILIDEMQNGKEIHYMVPKNTIPYKPFQQFQPSIHNTSTIQPLQPLQLINTPIQTYLAQHKSPKAKTYSKAKPKTPKAKPHSKAKPKSKTPTKQNHSTNNNNHIIITNTT